MVVDHFGGDSWLYAITGGNRFYVSAAEGFIFISGFVMGQAYRAQARPLRACPRPWPRRCGGPARCTWRPWR